MKKYGSDIDSDQILVYRCIEIQLPAIIFMYKIESTQLYLSYQKFAFRTLKCHNHLHPESTAIFKNKLTILAGKTTAFAHIYPTKPTL